MPDCKISHLDDKSFVECGKKGYAMLCDHLSLKQVPQAYPKPVNKTEFTPPLCLLDLGYNDFNRLENKSFVDVVNLNSTEILWLYLHFSNLSYIASDAFENLTQLLYLNLSGNNLHLSDSFGQGVFNPLVNLQFINLKKNHFETFEKIGSELSVLKALTVLEINLCEACVFGADFRMLTKLVKLGLAGRSVNDCYKPVVRNETFLYVTGVQELFLSSCSINTIERNAFSYFTNLTLLDISYNQGLNFTGMNEALFGLRNSSTLKTLNVNRINPIYEAGITLELSHIENLKTLRSLTYLHMDLNKIEVFDENILNPYQLPSTLRDFTLSGNRLTYGNYTRFIQNANGIKSLDISRQHLNFDPFKHEHYGVEMSAYLRNLRLYRNSSILATMNNDCPLLCDISLPSSLEKIKWRKSFLNVEIKKPIRICASGLKYLDVSFNLITNLNEIVCGLDNLTYFDISENYCSEIQPAFFKKLTSLNFLNISENMLGQSLHPDNSQRGDKLFKGQQNLTVLDLSSNKITHLSKDIFKPLTNLRHLNLSDNMIEEWNSSLENILCLHDINLSGNKLYGLPESLTNYLNSLLDKDCCKNKSTCVEVNLSSNPIECTCKTLPFLKWMRYSRVVVLFLPNDVCRLNGENYRFDSNENLEHLISILVNDKCRDRSWVIWTVSIACVAVTFIVSVGISFFVYRNRWKLRYIYYSRNRRYRHEGFERLFENDAFVSYAKNSASFIKNQMVPVLETQHQLHLWVADRNSLPGTSIAENIIHGIYNSRKSVLLINREYLNDNWCDYEMNMAQIESVETKRNLLIVVLMEEIPMQKLPICLLKFLRNERSIEYPEDDRDMSAFWLNLAHEINSS